MEQVVANIYAACLSAEAEPHAELVDLTINAVQDGLAGPNKDETLGAIFTAVEELTTERQHKGALFRIKPASIAAAAKTLPQNTRDALLKSLKAMDEVAGQQSLSATSNTIKLLVDSISKVETAVGQPAPPPAPPEQASESPKLGAQATLSDYLKQHARHAASNKISFAPDIPLKKLSGALSSIGGLVKPEDLVVLVDDTVFGGAKEGVFITNDRIIVKEKFQDLAVYRLDAIHHLGADGLKIFVNHREIVGLTQPDKEDMELLFSAINEYLQLINRKVSPPAPPPPAHHEPEYDEEGEEDNRATTDFFDNLIREMRMSVARGEVDDVEHYELIIDTLELAGSLPLFCGAHCSTLSADARWAATSDAVRYEVIIYLCTLIQYLLVTKCNFSEDDMTTFVARFMAAVAAPYSGMLEPEHYEVTSLRRAANPALYIQESTVFSNWRSEAQRYLEAMHGDLSQLSEIFHGNLVDPGVAYFMSDDDERRLRSRIEALQEEFLSLEASFAYMRGISQDMETKMMRFFERINF